MLAAGGSSLDHRVEGVCPGPESLAWLVHTVAQLQAADPLAPVAVAVSSQHLEHVVRRTLAEHGCANVQVHIQLRAINASVAGPASSNQLTAVQEAAAVRAAVRDAAPPSLDPLADHPGLRAALQELFRELRHQEAAEATLAEIAARSPVAEAAVAIYRRYQELTAEHADLPGLAQRALRALERGEAATRAAALGALVLYLPSRLDNVEVAVLAQLGRLIPIHVAFALFGDEDNPADRLIGQTAAAVATALGVPLRRAPAAG